MKCCATIVQLSRNYFATIVQLSCNCRATIVQPCQCNSRKIGFFCSFPWFAPEMKSCCAHQMCMTCFFLGCDLARSFFIFLLACCDAKSSFVFLSVFHPPSAVRYVGVPLSCFALALCFLLLECSAAESLTTFPWIASVLSFALFQMILVFSVLILSHIPWFRRNWWTPNTQNMKNQMLQKPLCGRRWLDYTESSGERTQRVSFALLPRWTHQVFSLNSPGLTQHSASSLFLNSALETVFHTFPKRSERAKVADGAFREIVV